MDHFLNQGTHFAVPCPVLFILDAVPEVSQDMGKTFLMSCPILVKSALMVMDSVKTTISIFFDIRRVSVRCIF